MVKRDGVKWLFHLPNLIPELPSHQLPESIIKYQNRKVLSAEVFIVSAISSGVSDITISAISPASTESFWARRLFNNQAPSGTAPYKIPEVSDYYKTEEQVFQLKKLLQLRQAFFLASLDYQASHS